MNESYESPDSHESPDEKGAGGTEPSGERSGRARAGGSRLPEELRQLGRSLDGPGAAGSDSMVERVLEQILAERIPAPVAEPPGPGERLRAVRRWARVRWRALTASLCGVLTVLVLTPPVRAAVVDWFDFGGVEVRYDPSAVPSPGARVPGCGPSLTSAQAERRAGFAPLVPDALGMPDAVTVTPQPQGRLLMSLCWREHGHTVRLDEYPESLDINFAKAVREHPEWVQMGGSEDYGSQALWFPKPHLLSFWLIDADGDRFTRSERTAGPTLLWMHEQEVTLRLEGVASKARAVEIAKSLK
ncbi:MULTISPECIES: hypothetical protein [Streptomyces]|uniref:DUF3558 domain-containing protein n=1 Tax=Streptomyces dengpaensis TaxID=2049881 RepID=A0ABN5I0K0_9ACTN|nr:MULTISPECIES: hypothetical protein [Streptomyces]AVH56943.1 hypothetical protein C4B68_15435 [Streptomyces dengpaensis]PIB09159.1 hypothetical protein B1C81_13085 [Streptomyces sp. HG99]